MFTTGVLAANTERWIWWDWIGRNTDLIGDALWTHVKLSVIAVVAGLVISVPLGVLAHRRRRLLGPVLGVSGVLYTIPALAAFALLIPYTGGGDLTVVIPLTSYTLLILVRNVVTGLEGVPEEVRESAVAMGMGPTRLLMRVELPLALPALFAGLRIAMVTTIGMLTIAALVGLGGLGQLIMIGLNRPIRTAVTAGAVLSIVLAILADIGLAGMQRLFTPWSVKRPAGARP